MPNITIGPQDWQNVAMGYAKENINLKAQLAALARTILEMEIVLSENGAKEKGNVPVSQGQIQEDNQ